ncbi:MAG: rbsK [Ilumatobacteraceae bacterium]|nr:rbsK [Ilumatobacteraceae bacterium]
MSRFDVCVVGSANLDLVARTSRLPGAGETVLGSDFAEHAGGKGLNQAVAAARAGAQVAFVGAVGTDAAGEQLLAVMALDGIDVTRVERVAAPTGRALIGVSGAGENSIIVVPGANATVRVDQVTADRLPGARVVLVQLEVPLAAVAAALATARHAGAMTVLNPAPAQELDASVLAHCDVVVPNEHEAALLGGPLALLGFGASVVVVTKGAEGAEVYTTDGMSVLPAFAVDAVDTTAAGDAFCGALCARLAAGERLEDAMRFAMAAGALATTRQGAVPSLPDEVAIRVLLTSAA